MVTVLALVGLTKKRFGYYAILKILSLRSPSTVLNFTPEIKEFDVEDTDDLPQITDTDEDDEDIDSE